MNIELKKCFEDYDSKGKLILPDSHCGPGSTLWYTENIRRELPKFFKKFDIKSILDAPCGDYQWMNKIEFSKEFDYLGADLHHAMIERNKKLYHANFIQLDITEDYMPSRDLIFVRDCLFHFSNENKSKFLLNFLRSNFKYLLTSNHPKCNFNENLPTGHFRQINWNINPWNFPKSIDLIVDYDEKDIRFSAFPYRTMELWSHEQIKIAFQKLITNYLK